MSYDNIGRFDDDDDDKGIFMKQEVTFIFISFHFICLIFIQELLSNNFL